MMHVIKEGKMNVHFPHIAYGTLLKVPLLHFNTGSMNTPETSVFSSSTMRCLLLVGAHLPLHLKGLQNQPTSSLHQWPFTGYS